MASPYLYPLPGSPEVGAVKLFGRITFGAAGAVSSFVGKGFSVAKTAGETGRYTVTLAEQWVDFLGCQVTMQVAADAAIGATAGFIPSVRNLAVSTTKTFDIQLSDAAGADAEPTSGFSAYLEITLKMSTVRR